MFAPRAMPATSFYKTYESVTIERKKKTYTEAIVPHGVVRKIHGNLEVSNFAVRSLDFSMLPVRGTGTCLSHLLYCFKVALCRNKLS